MYLSLLKYRIPIKNLIQLIDFDTKLEHFTTRPEIYYHSCIQDIKQLSSSPDSFIFKTTDELANNIL